MKVLLLGQSLCEKEKERGEKGRERVVILSDRLLLGDYRARTHASEGERGEGEDDDHKRNAPLYPPAARRVKIKGGKGAGNRKGRGLNKKVRGQTVCVCARERESARK